MYSEQVECISLWVLIKAKHRTYPQTLLKTVAMITRRNVIINLWFIFVVLYTFVGCSSFTLEERFYEGV
jgi:hypothetical protein